MVDDCGDRYPGFLVSEMTNLFLFHELRIGNVVYYILPKNRCSQDRVYLFGIQILQLPVQNELIAFRAKVDCDSSTK